jgi:DsbC/DsbD-like thiol-disulfide interchange protein
MRPGTFALTVLLLAAAEPTAIAQKPELTATLSRVGKGGADSAMLFRVVMRVTEGWHIGAPTPGARGLPTDLTWRLPQGWRLIREQWPTPKQEMVGRDSVFTYRDTVVVEASIAGQAGTRRDPIRVILSYGICSNDLCIPGRKTLTYRE